MTAPIGTIDRSIHLSKNSRASMSDGRRRRKLPTRGCLTSISLAALTVLALMTLLFMHMAATAPKVNHAPDQSNASTLPSWPPDMYWCIVLGFVYDADGVTPLVDCTVEITNVETSESLASTSHEDGLYMTDLAALPSGWEYGDIINVTAVKGTQTGWNEAPVTNDGGTFPPYVWINVTMSTGTAIPEFGSPITVVGIMIMIMVVLLHSKRREERV